MRFRVVLPTFPFSECLRDLANCLTDALRRSGHGVELDTEFMPTRDGDMPHDREGSIVQVVLGAHHGQVKLPEYPVVIYQTETPNSSWFTAGYKTRLLAALAVWEAAPGFVTQEPERTSVVPPGVDPERVLSPDSSKQDIPILFYGSLSERRVALLTKLQDAGLAPSVHFNVFGAERDALIDRAKIVVDIKQGDFDPNDNTRLFALDARSACVLSEHDDDPSRALVPWKIVEQCRELLENPRLRRERIRSRQAELKPMDVTAAVAQLGEILRRGPRVTPMYLGHAERALS